MTTTRAFRGCHCPAEVILWAVRWSLPFPLSYRDLERRLADRGVEVDRVTLYRWVQRFASKLEQRLRRHLRPCRGPWRVDATSIRVGGAWRYLDRAVDGTGQTIDFLLCATRDKRAAKRFFRKALGRDHSPDGEPDPSRPWEIELPPWLYNAILRRRDILAVHPAYFGLTGGIERWLYRLARKAVPDKADFPGISFRMETLFARSGLSGRLRQFRAKLEKIAETQPLPEYDIIINRDGRHELVTLIRNRAKSGRLPRGVRRLALP